MAVVSYDEDSHLTELLDRVEQGEEVTIARHGTPVAKLVLLRPAPSKRDERKIREALRRLDELSKRVSFGDLKVEELINEGRR